MSSDPHRAGPHNDPHVFAQWVVEHRAVCGVGEQRLAEGYLSLFEQFEAARAALQEIADGEYANSVAATTPRRIAREALNPAKELS